MCFYGPRVIRNIILYILNCILRKNYKKLCEPQIFPRKIKYFLLQSHLTSPYFMHCRLNTLAKLNSLNQIWHKSTIITVILISSTHLRHKTSPSCVCANPILELNVLMAIILFHVLLCSTDKATLFTSLSIYLSL